jgi:hypothetical protein
LIIQIPIIYFVCHFENLDIVKRYGKKCISPLCYENIKHCEENRDKSNELKSNDKLIQVEMCILRTIMTKNVHLSLFTYIQIKFIKPYIHVFIAINHKESLVCVHYFHPFLPLFFLME